ncbi:MAG: hypothetical protein AMXMBFR4_02920 [Candidatus Hydrogenedentota bacterium]
MTKPDFARPTGMFAGMPILHWLALGAVLALALTVRLYRITSESLWFDELVTYTCLDRPTLMEFARREAYWDILSTPLYFVSAYYYAKVFGTGELTMRVFSIIPGMLVVAALYFIGRRLFGHTAGITAALCASLAKLQIYMSQEIRNYAMWVLLAIFAMYALHEAVTTNKRHWWILNVGLNGLVALTHLFGLLLLFTQGVYLLIVYWGQWRRVLVWGLAHIPFLVIIPIWIASITSGRLTDETDWIPPAHKDRLIGAYFYVYAGSKLDGMDFIHHLPFQVPVHQLLGIAMIVLNLWWIAACCWKELTETGYAAQGYRPKSALLLLAWLMGPPLTLFLVSRYIRPSFVERYALTAMPALFLIAGGAVAALPRRPWRYAVVAMLLIIYLGNLVDLQRPIRPDYRQAGNTIRSHASPNDKVYTPIEFTWFGLSHYSGLDQSHFVISDDYARKAVEAVDTGQAAWIFMLHVPGTWDPEDVESLLAGKPFAVTRDRFSGRWDVYLWHVAPAGG